MKRKSTCHDNCHLSTDLSKHVAVGLHVVQIPPISVGLTKEVHVSHHIQRITEGFTVHGPNNGLLMTSEVEFDD